MTYYDGYPTTVEEYRCSFCGNKKQIRYIRYPVDQGGPEPMDSTDCPKCGCVEGDELPLPGYCRTCWRDSGEAVRVATTDGADRCAVCIEEGCE